MLGPRLGLLALGLLVAAMGCTAKPSGTPAALPVGRPMYQMDAQHTGRSPYIGPRQPLLLRTFNTSFVEVPDPVFDNADIQSSAAIAPDGTAYIGLHSGTLFALRDPVGAGNQLAARWSFHPAGGSSWHATPAIGRDGTVYVGFSTDSWTPDAAGKLYALQAPSTGIEPTVLWQVDLGPGRQTSSPTLGRDGTIYATGGEGRLSAIAPDGQVQWTAQTGPTLKASPALGQDGTVYISSMNGKLYAVAPPPDSPAGIGSVGARPAPVNNVGAAAQNALANVGKAVVPSQDSRAGQQVVTPPQDSSAGQQVVAPPEDSLARHQVVAPPQDSSAGQQVVAPPSDLSLAVSAVDAQSPGSSARVRVGSIRWTFRFAEFPGSGKPVVQHSPPAGSDGIGSGASPTVGPDGTIYVGANNSNFYAISPDGNLEWLFATEREVAGIWSTAALSADGQTLYFGANKGGMYAVNRSDGTLRWQYPIVGSIYSSPALDATDTLYTGSTVGHVFAIDGATGRLIFDYDAGAPIWTAPALRPDGSILIADRRGRVMLLGEG